MNVSSTRVGGPPPGPRFVKFVQAPSGLPDAVVAIAACRAGGVGVINAELDRDGVDASERLARVARYVRSPIGIRLGQVDRALERTLSSLSTEGVLGWVFADAAGVSAHGALLASLRSHGVQVLLQVTSAQWPVGVAEAEVDGLVVKGHEAGGLVGEESSFILVQRWQGRTGLPVYVHGGLTPHVAAACAAVGVCGGVLDSQVLLMPDLDLSSPHDGVLAKLAGNETLASGDAERGEYFRFLLRPGYAAARELAETAEGAGHDELRAMATERVCWGATRDAVLPLGQDVCFAGDFAERYGTLARLFDAIDTGVERSLRLAVEVPGVCEGGPLADALGTRLPLIQGPMTRVSDRAEFARAVGEEGALPMVAFALLRGRPLEALLEQTAGLMGDRPWGIGLLGFAPQALLEEQLAIALRHSPRFAIIAGGRPDQAVELERAGIASFLHVPSAKLIPMFVAEGARRFIFEGRECGGHIGPLSSFVLWSTMVDALLEQLDGRDGLAAESLEVVFAGGIHDAMSSAMLQVLAAPLLERGVRVGILMGSAYLFTREIVASGAVVPRFQREALECERTVSLESGPGHASRCSYSPFAREFFEARQRLARDEVSGDERRKVLDDLILGRLRMASKGRTRNAEGQLERLEDAEQHSQGMYMLGQVAALRSQVTDVASLHAEVTGGAAKLLQARLAEVEGTRSIEPGPAPVDVAIVGIASVLPKASSTEEYWANILAKVDAITEIPAHRWDFRLYFDEDRGAKDKIYSKWGGFLDDVVFDPIEYGMPPRSVASVDPMQLIALEVAQRTLIDAGYVDRPFDRERASVIVGASGGTGDVGTMYGLRAELPRFAGQLPDEVAARLPEWTEDSFAGILNNVTAGRIANRLNLGGVNFTTDAACASSLAALYQGISELTAGRSDFVIAGGVDTVQGPFGFLCFSKTQALSPRGRSRSFDASGDGIVISEGVAMVALKRLADAERDGDRIYAVIKGIGGSSDGRARGMTAPLPEGQLRAMRRAYRQAGFGPETVGLFEAHGTGTKVGDATELESTGALVRESGGVARGAIIGSVKTMIGHTKATAGVAGLIKAALALRHRCLPPQRTDGQPNDLLAQPDFALALLDEATPWVVDEDARRRAAVSAFGFGGTNFHVVLEEYAQEYRPWLREPVVRRWPVELLLWSAADRETLKVDLLRMRERLEGPHTVSLRALAATLSSRFEAGKHSVAIVASGLDDLKTKLGVTLESLEGQAMRLPRGIVVGAPVEPQARGKVAFLFSGQGSQYPGMLRELAVHFPECAEALAEADRVLKEPFEARFGRGRRLSRFIHPRGCHSAQDQAQAAAELTATDVAQPALGAVEVAALRLVEGMGLSADMLAGHSFGEFVAHHAAGAIDFASLMRLAAARGSCIVDAAGAGGSQLGHMVAVLAPREQVELAIADIPGVIVANHNAPEQSILSGSREATRAAVLRLEARGMRVSELQVAAAFHSELMQPAREPLARHIEATPWVAPRVPVYANTSGAPHAPEVDAQKRAMAEHLVRPVEFVRQIETMYADGARIFVELGPKAVLTRLTEKILGERTHLAVAIDQDPGLEGLLRLVGQLCCAGIELRLSRLFEGRVEALADPYQWPSPIPPPKHAFLVNGSGVRPAGTAERQIGLTLEQAAALPEPNPALPSMMQADGGTAPRNVSRSESSGRQTVSGPHRTQPRRSAERPMTDTDEKQQLMAAANSSLAGSYFDMMRQFLETQERVMAMLVGEGQAVRADSSRAPRNVPPVRTLQPGPPPPARAAPPAPSVPAPTPAPGAAPPTTGVAPPPPPVVAPAVAPMGSDTPAPTNGHAVPQARASSTESLSREALEDMLLAVVEEKTGYPRDMVGLGDNLESDLGIDSIKRIEVVGGVLQRLPAARRDALTERRGEINRQPTLSGMLDILADADAGAGAGAAIGEAIEGGAAAPFERTGAGAEIPTDHLPRYVLEVREEPLEASALRRLRPGRYLVTEDALGVAPLLVAKLGDHGCEGVVVSHDVLSDESHLRERLNGLSNDAGSWAGVVHLGALGAASQSFSDEQAASRAALHRNEKALFGILHHLDASLSSDGHVLGASGLGGCFGRDGQGDGALRLEGGAVGLLKSYAEERPGLRVKAVDVDPLESVEAIAEQLFDELALVGGRQEVGYRRGRRHVFRSVERALSVPSTLPQDLHDVVVLATGGARGITAEVLRGIALPGNVLVLTGRGALPEPEPALTASLGAAELRAHYIAQVRAGALSMKPAEVGRKVRQVLAARELRSNLADLRQRGAEVEYHAVDVTDEAALGALVADVEARHGAIHGVVHGAGIIEDKRVADKSSESWSRVVETKVLGLLSLQKLVRPPHLRFFVAFSSVAGRYGNSGQADYATANELMNRLCCQLNARWSGRVNVMALCWGPWGPTKFGAGMVTAETEAKFAEKGVHLVSAEVGRALFLAELARPAAERSAEHVEVVCGRGPWEQREAELGAIQCGPTATREARRRLGPLLSAVEVEVEPQGDQLVSFELDGTHAYMEDHRIDGVPVLPAAVAAEMLAEAAAALWPGWTLVELRDCRLMKGIDLPTPARKLRIVVSPAPHGQSDGFEVTAVLSSPPEGKRPSLIHYRATLRFEQSFPEAFELSLTTGHGPSMDRHEAYGEHLFHGPAFQVLDDVEGMGPEGARARVTSVCSARFMRGDGASDPWIFDPGLLDAAPQMAILWARSVRGETTLPTCFGRVVRYREKPPKMLRMSFEVVAGGDPSQVCANVYFLDEAGTVVMLIERMECVASAGLNRLARGRSRSSDSRAESAP